MYQFCYHPKQQSAFWAFKGLCIGYALYKGHCTNDFALVLASQQGWAVALCLWQGNGSSSL